MIYDVIVIGGGPAGVTAAIYSERKRLKTLLLTKDIGGQASWSGDIENYPGTSFISGPELSKKFEDHLKSQKVSYMEGVEIADITKVKGNFSVNVGKKNFQSKTLIVTTGKKPRHLGIPGEAIYNNRGVSYCATCDGPFFAGKNVAVIGGGNSALDAALQLTQIANRVYIVNNTKSINGDKIMLQKIKSSKKVHFFNDSECLKVLGDKFVSGLMIQQKNKKQLTLPVRGVFIEIGSVPVNSLVTSLKVKINNYGEIIVDQFCNTNVKGLFAAGDVTDIPEKQLVVAAGHGSIASLSAFKYLTENDVKHSRHCYNHK